MVDIGTQVIRQMNAPINWRSDEAKVIHNFGIALGLDERRLNEEYQGSHWHTDTGKALYALAVASGLDPAQLNDHYYHSTSHHSRDADALQAVMITYLISQGKKKEKSSKRR